MPQKINQKINQKIKQILKRAFVVAALVPFSGCSTPQKVSPTPDAPSAIKTAYAMESIPRFASLDDLVKWTGDHFKYDSKRLHGTTSAEGEPSPAFQIRTPQELYELHAGICTDLAHFGVQVARRDQLAPAFSYLKLYLKPRLIGGHSVSRHWLAIAQTEEGLLRFFGDSRHPGKLSQGYATVEAFLNTDSEYKKSPILQFEVREIWDRPTRKIALVRKRKIGPLKK